MNVLVQRFSTWGKRTLWVCKKFTGGMQNVIENITILFYVVHQCVCWKLPQSNEMSTKMDKNYEKMTSKLLLT